MYTNLLSFVSSSIARAFLVHPKSIVRAFIKKIILKEADFHAIWELVKGNAA